MLNAESAEYLPTTTTLVARGALASRVSRLVSCISHCIFRALIRLTHRFEMSSSRVPVAHAEPADDVLAHRVRPARDSRGASRAGDNGSSDEDNDNVEAGMISSNSPQDEERVVVESLPGGYQVLLNASQKWDKNVYEPASLLWKCFHFIWYTFIFNACESITTCWYDIS